jgi:hypothetical protein
MNKLIYRQLPQVAFLIAFLLVGGCDSGGPSPEQTFISCDNRANFAAPELSKYILPFPVGETSEILQAYCTTGSHSDQLAYDLIRPFGSDVSAVRGGEVKNAVSHHPDQTEDNVHNHVLIVHDDGTTAFYAHLQQDSILVSVGDFVNAGQLIGSNGSSGTPTACDTHILNPPRDQCAILHFGVYATYPPEEGNDIAVNFRNADGMLNSSDGLLRGQTYIALSY